MAKAKKSPHRAPDADGSGAMPPTPTVPRSIESEEFEQAFGESVANTLDLATWDAGENLPNLYAQLEREIEAALQQTNGVCARIRNEVFPLIATAPKAPRGAGFYAAKDSRKPLDLLETFHKSYLFNGQVEACDGTMAVHDTLPLTIIQIGVALVSYRGDQGTWLHRLFRRDLRSSGHDPIAEALEILQRRREREAVGETDSTRDNVSSLLARGIMAFAERAVLLEKSTAPWRVGHGAAVPYEMLTGSGNADLLATSLPLLRRLIAEHQKFVYVPSRTHRDLLTLGHALHPLEYLIVDDLTASLLRIAQGNYRGERWDELASDVRDFVREIGPQVVRGVFRASRMAPPYGFYAHIDYAHEAALIAMADATLQAHRGFPMLIDLADTVCSTTFGASILDISAQVAYAEAGAPYEYLSERATRR